MKTEVNENLLIIARVQAGERHRAAGGKGAPEPEAVAREYEKLSAELEAEAETRKAPEPKPEPVAPVLADGAEARKNYRTLRTLDGREARAYAKGQRVSTGFQADGMSLSEFGCGLAALITGNVRGHEAEVRALSTGVNTAGGILVPEELSAQILDLARAKSRCFEAGATVVDMPGQQVRIPTMTTDPTFALTAENATISDGDPAFGSILLNAKKYASLVKISNELMEDAAAPGDAIINALASAWAVELDGLCLRFLLDNGDLTAETSVGAVNFDDVLNTVQAILEDNHEPTALIAHPKTLIALAKLKDDTTNSYKAPPAMLANLPMLSSTNLADSEAIAGDFTRLIVGQRGGLSIELSREAGTSFEADQTWVRAIWRGAINTGYISAFHGLEGITY